MIQFVVNQVRAEIFLVSNVCTLLRSLIFDKCAIVIWIFIQTRVYSLIQRTMSVSEINSIPRTSILRQSRVFRSIACLRPLLSRVKVINLRQVSWPSSNSSRRR